jgi:SAM-dependent methyltransferase
MARYFDEVLAIDPDGEMTAYARRSATELGLDNVAVRQLRAEDVSADVGPLRAAIFGASFHWTDRPRVGDMIYDLLEPRGHLAILSPGSVHTGTTDWEAAIRAVLVRHLGPERRAGGGLYREGERHEQALRRTRFDKIEIVDIPVREQWSIDQMVGYLFSTSAASKAVLGDRAEAFEQDVRRSLEQSAPGGQLEKLVEYGVILAQR